MPQAMLQDEDVLKKTVFLKHQYFETFHNFLK